MAGVRKNLIGSIYLAFANGGAQLVLVPVLLHFWGTELYADWLVLYTIPALFAFADAGIVNSVGNYVTLAVERGDTKDASAKLNAAWKFQALASLLITLVVTLLALLGPLKQWLGVSQLSQSSLVVTVGLLALYAGASLQTGILAAHFRAAGSYPRYLFWMASTKIVEVILICLIAAYSDKMEIVALSILTLKSLSIWLLLQLARNQLPAVRLRMLDGKWIDFKPLLKSGIDFLLFTLSQAVMNQGSVLAVNHALGAQSVVLLSVCRQLARLFQLGVAVIQTSVLPEITKAYGAKLPERALMLQRKALLIPLLIGPLYILGCLFFGNSIITLWTQQNLAIGSLLFFACSLEAVLFGISFLAVMIPWATNHVHALSVTQISGIILALIIGSFLLPALGNAALPLAFSVVALVVAIQGFWLGLRLCSQLISIPLSPVKCLS